MNILLELLGDDDVVLAFEWIILVVVDITAS
jgi:hypothetical protein